MAAIKVLSVDTSEEDVADIRREIALLSQLKQGEAQNVTRYHGSILCGEKLWIIMDYCHGGSIRTLMKSGRFEEKYCAVIIREILIALAFIHKCGIIHRDVKAANILVANDGSVQLCDFGVATQLAANHLKRNTFVGTPYWMAPEVITEGLSYNSKADIWSLGITVYEIVTGNPPYADQEPMRAIIMIPRNQPPRLEGNTSSNATKDFVALCCREAPNDRPSAEELSKSKFIKQVSKLQSSILKELIVRFERWQESGGVRKSLLAHNRRGSTLSDLRFDPAEVDEPIGWDFDTVKSYSMVPSQQPAYTELSPLEHLDNGLDDSADTETRIRHAPDTLHLSNNIASRSEHRLVQLFEDPTKTNQQNGYRSRKNTLLSRPESPSHLTIPIYPPQPSGPMLDTGIMQSPPATVPAGNPLSTANSLRLPEITASEPFQIEIPAPEDTLKLDGSRSRSSTVSRAGRSNSVTATMTPRAPRHVQNMSPPRSSHARGISPSRQQSSLQVKSGRSSPTRDYLPPVQPSVNNNSTSERSRPGAVPLSKSSNSFSKSTSSVPLQRRETIVDSTYKPSNAAKNSSGVVRMHELLSVN